MYQLDGQTGVLHMECVSSRLLMHTPAGRGKLQMRRIQLFYG